MDEKIKKLEPVFNGLERHWIDPSKIASNVMFAYCVIQYLDGDITIHEILDLANKINIISGGRYNSVQYMEA